MENINTEWINDYPNPLLIAGPCSAESEEQMLTTARQMKDSGNEISFFRAGIWKPRTKPNCFEGVGSIGLDWLKKVKEEVGFKTATEVANAHHIDAVLKADVDLIWIGARSTVNPFVIQEIAEALRGTDKIVLVKNPINLDLSLWIGALERLAGQNIQKLGVIHRGFSTYNKTKYRNTPHWQIPIDFKNLFPHLPMIIDPSHICGNRTGIFSVTQEALNLDYQGMMIETHCNPDKAWSDSAQQITPQKLKEITDNLVIRTAKTSFDEIERYRTLISDIDFQMIELLSERMKYAEVIGELKKEKNATVFQLERWKKITEYVEDKAKEKKLNPRFLMKLFKVIHEASIDVQNKIMLKK
ncbi:MAG: 3-deoxy-7-phosphoheptulonate synthase [Flavobacteriales bacterium]|nr:MAG: 3-deoxy-7-phosphoheptulonate synthase [Flavobacteriales bacterium]